MEKLFGICALVILLCNTAEAITVSDYYHPVGASENLVARFDHSIEATTTSAYNGLLLVEISGLGWNNPSEVFDAFYFVFNASQIGWIPQKSGSLRLAFDGGTYLSGTSYSILDDVSYGGVFPLYSIVFNESVGYCAGLNTYCVPEYSSAHVYRFVLQINGAPRVLNFGFGDGGIGDNSGEYSIVITPVSVGATVPLPTSALLFVSGLIPLFSRKIVSRL